MTESTRDVDDLIPFVSVLIETREAPRLIETREALRAAALRLAEAAERYAETDAELDRALRNLNYELTGCGK